MSRKATKVKWTERMNSDIIECKKKAKEMVSSNNPPYYTNGRKKGYIEVMNSVALKSFMVLPTLILQKPSATFKSKEHSAAIERRLNLWRQGDLDLLLKEVRFIQGKFVNSKKARTVEDISKVFANLVFQGKLSAAIKLLDSESSTGLLNLTPEVLEGLKEKHPGAADIADESLLYGPIDYIPPGVFDLIDEKMIFDAASKTKGSAGPSGMNAELYRRILCSKNFKAEGKVLREEIAFFTRNLLKIACHPSLLEGYTSCRGAEAGGFWSRGVTAFFDVRVTHVNSKCNQGKATSTIFKEQEEEKKRKYQQRVLDVEMGSFTPLVFGTNGGMGADCNCFLKRLAEKLSEKNEEPYHITITWNRTLLSFEILRSVHTCVRGSRTPFHKIPFGDFIDDCRLNASQACLR